MVHNGMVHNGDVHLADVNDERRLRVLVVSNDRFHHVSDRALVAPQIAAEPDATPFPWHVQVGDDVFAIDLLRSIPVDRLLERVDRASAATMLSVRRTLLHIT